MNFFITNREIIIKNGKETVREDGKERAADTLRFGIIENDEFKLFPEPRSEGESLYSTVKDVNPEKLKGSAKFFRILYDELTKGKKGESINNVLLFIHGFNTDLDGVRGNVRTLEKNFVKKKGSPVNHIIVFTWPGKSPEIPFHYFNDRNDAIHSGEALARGIQKVSKFFREFLLVGKNQPCERRLHLMVHSMGHRVLKHLMLELQKSNTQVPELFHEVLLMAADIEYDIFEPDCAYESLIKLGKRVHVYFHEKDRVLDLSKFTKNFSNRLGRYGRKRIDPTQIDIIDANVTKVKDDLRPDFKNDQLNHWYYYTSSEVISDVISVLNGSSSKYAVKK